MQTNSRLLLSQVIDQIPELSARHQSEAKAMVMKRHHLPTSESSAGVDPVSNMAAAASQQQQVDTSVRSNIFIDVCVHSLSQYAHVLTHTNNSKIQVRQLLVNMFDKFAEMRREVPMVDG